MIIIQKPKERYIADLTYILIEFTNNFDCVYYKINSKYKYILTICDHFSKFANSYLLTDKKQNSILDKIKLFIDFYGIPNLFGSYNGKEFINSALINYLSINKLSLLMEPHIIQDHKGQLNLSILLYEICY